MVPCWLSPWLHHAPAVPHGYELPLMVWTW